MFLGRVASRPGSSDAHFRLGDLARARAQLVKTKTAPGNSKKEYDTPETIEAFKRLVSDINREISNSRPQSAPSYVDDPSGACRRMNLERQSPTRNENPPRKPPSTRPIPLASLKSAAKRE